MVTILYKEDELRMSEKKGLSIQDIKRRVRSSFVTLFLRKVTLRAVGFITINIILARLLPVETLGIFNIATAIITFFAFFSDVGLAGSLIQKKDEVDEDDIKTTFTIQEIIVGLLSLTIIVCAPLLAEHYRLDNDGVWLIRALGVSFFLSSLKVVPSVLLERNLKFGPLVAAEIVETLVFNILLVVLVVSNFGLWSFSIAAIARGLVGTILIYILTPIKISLGIKKENARTLLSFGIPFQINNLLALAKDRLVPLVIASMVGPQQFSYITWSQGMALIPLEFLGEINRLTFPAFSRLQDDKEALGKAVEKALFVAGIVIFPLLFGLAAVFPYFVKIVVTSKFEAAIPSFYLFAFSSFLAVISTILTNTLNSTGKIKTTLRLMIMWTFLTWLLTPFLVFHYGFMGVSLAAFIISFTSLLTVYLVKRILKVRVLSSIALPTLASMLMGLVVYFYSIYFVVNKYWLVSAILLGAGVYVLIIYIFGRKQIIEDLRSLKR